MARVVDTSVVRRVRDVGAKSRRVAQTFVRETFNARPVAVVAGMDMLQIRDLMSQMLRSQGGRPSLADAQDRVKVPKIAEDWAVIEKISIQIAADLAFRPSPAQVAAVMLHWAVTHMPEQDIQSALRA